MYRPAQRVCARCPVRRECLTLAYEYEQPWWSDEQQRWRSSASVANGVYGGIVPEDRHHRNVLHYPECQRTFPKCKGCRPIPERVDLLEELFQQTAHRAGLLTDEEEVV